MKRAILLLICVLIALSSCAHTPSPSNIRHSFLSKANEVTVSSDSITFSDASERKSITVKKNPERVVILYPSLTTLWYEAGGEVIGCIGADSSVSLYREYIGRDISKDDGVTVVSTSAASKKWDIEKIVSLSPDLIICSTSMGGYETIRFAADMANITVIAADYNDFSDYLKWFNVFCHLNGRADLWESEALTALSEVTSVLSAVNTSNAPTVFCMFSGTETLQANTPETVLGGMIEALGAVNIAYGYRDAERIPINLEAVYAANPDIILVQCHAGTDAARAHVEAEYGENPVWQSLRAVKEGRVYYLEKELFHNKPNSRFADAYKALANILYPIE